jgi:hypothetical protein
MLEGWAEEHLYDFEQELLYPNDEGPDDTSVRRDLALFYVYRIDLTETPQKLQAIRRCSEPLLRRP